MKLQPKILVVSDDSPYVSAILMVLGSLCNVVCASSVLEANDIITNSLKTGELFRVAIVERTMESGLEFVRRLIDVVRDINVIVITPNYKAIAGLPFQPDAFFVKAVNPLPTSFDEINGQTLLETVKRLIEPRRTFNGSVSARRNRWHVTGFMKGINELKPFTHIYIGEEGRRVEKITLMTHDGECVNVVTYPENPGDVTKPIGVQTLIGCPECCRFCINWRIHKNGRGRPISFVRRLTDEEIESEIYHAILSPRFDEVFEDGSAFGIVVNFTGAGDALVHNLRHCASVIEDLAQIKRPEFSFIITSVGSEKALKRYLDQHVFLPRTTHYFSANSMFAAKRGWMMPGSKHRSFEEMVDLYCEIAENTKRNVTASFAIFKGVNDSQEDAEEIARFFKDKPFNIKLMAGCPGSLGRTPDITEEEVRAFAEKIIAAGMPRERVRFREIFGVEGKAGCGNTVQNHLFNRR
jgi:adenine C2-methylase RlmN of 23S rRNA A2503 and tRNA A37